MPGLGFKMNYSTHPKEVIEMFEKAIDPLIDKMREERARHIGEILFYAHTSCGITPDMMVKFVFNKKYFIESNNKFMASVVEKIT